MWIFNSCRGGYWENENVNIPFVFIEILTNFKTSQGIIFLSLECLRIIGGGGCFIT